jgi:hypothetical protein
MRQRGRRQRQSPGTSQVVHYPSMMIRPIEPFGVAAIASVRDPRCKPCGTAKQGRILTQTKKTMHAKHADDSAWFAGPGVTRLIPSRVRWPQCIVHGEREADRVPEGSFRLSPSACFACIAFFICVKILPSRCRQQSATEVRVAMSDARISPNTGLKAEASGQYLPTTALANR